MAGPLLETKWHMPSRHRDLVDRARLVDLLRRGASAPLTLVSAPAGFGKTTLLAAWRERAAPPGAVTAWLSLDAGDDDLRTFLAYVFASLNAAAPGLLDDSSRLLESAEVPPDALLTSLINDLHGSGASIVLVLDDFHVIQSTEIHDAVAFLVEHLPRELRVVIASRSDPVLPLARLRARGDLVELRAADLRFTGDEAAAYLVEAMGLELTAPEVASLERRTEGWIAALQLAALSLRGRSDPAAFIETFAGDDRYVIDYLAGEVLDRQPDDLRRFLLRTSVLSRLDSSVCAAVTGVHDARTMLELLDRRNLFVVPLDDRRHSYRYHHLFADVLRARLLDELPDEVAELHRRAGDWFEDHGDRLEAVRHALAGGDVGRAADLIERSIPDMRRTRADATLRRWFDALPAAMFETRPLLAIGYVGVRMSSGELDGIEPLLAQAERCIDEGAARGGQSADGADAAAAERQWELDRLPAQIGLYKAGLALLRGDADATTTFARRAFDLSDGSDHLGRGSSAALLGLACWRRGELGDAVDWYVRALHGLEAAGHLSDVLGCSIAFADIRMAQGRLDDSLDLYERGRRLAARLGAPPRGAADMHVGIADVLRERGDLTGAVEQLEESDSLGPQAGLPQNVHRREVVMARIRAAGGDHAGALELLDRAEELYDGDFSPDVRPIGALRARQWLALGEVDRALRWAADRRLGSDDPLDYLREFEHATLAATLLASARAAGPRAEQDLAEAARLLDRLVGAARSGRRTGSLIELLAIRALAHEAAADAGGAASTLAEALALADSKGYVRVFLDHGPPMVEVLARLAGGEDPTTARAARRVLDGGATTLAGAPARHGAVDRGRAADQLGPVEPLSPRELDVLRLLRSELSGPEIARELVVSLNTVRTHTKNIYAKLGVTGRRAAVRTADELHL